MPTVFSVRREAPLGSGWDGLFWAKEDAEQRFEDLTIEYPNNRVRLFEFDASNLIMTFLPSVLDGDADYIEYKTLKDTDNPAADEDDVTWTELEFRPEGYFYIERLKASTSEYWPYRVDLNGMTNEDGYAVFDDTTETLIGVVVPSSNTYAFKASVNGHEAEQQFTNLKGAVIHIATEYNGV